MGVPGRCARHNTRRARDRAVKIETTAGRRELRSPSSDRPRWQAILESYLWDQQPVARPLMESSRFTREYRGKIAIRLTSRRSEAANGDRVNSTRSACQSRLRRAFEVTAQPVIQSMRLPMVSL